MSRGDTVCPVVSSVGITYTIASTTNRLEEVGNYIHQVVVQIILVKGGSTKTNKTNVASGISWIAWR